MKDLSLFRNSSILPGFWPAFSYTIAFNATGWPGAVVRCGTSAEGLPIGVQAVAHPWRDNVALAVAHNLCAPHLLQPLCASDGDVVDVRTVVRVERDKKSGHK